MKHHISERGMPPYVLAEYASPNHKTCLFWPITSPKVTCSLPYFIIPAPDTGRWPDSSPVIRYYF